MIRPSSIILLCATYLLNPRKALKLKVIKSLFYSVVRHNSADLKPGPPLTTIVRQVSRSAKTAKRKSSTSQGLFKTMGGLFKGRQSREGVLPTSQGSISLRSINRFPRLRDQPSPNLHYRPMLPATTTDRTKTTKDGELNVPYRLYRIIAPPTHQFRSSIVFLGAMLCVPTTTNLYIQALWATAYLDGKIQGLSPSPASPSSPQKSEEELIWDSTLTSRFGGWRYPTGYGARFPDFVPDAVPYWDLQPMYGPWPANLLGASCKSYSPFNIYSVFYVQL